LLSSHGKFQVVGEAEDGIGAIRCAQELQPDLILMDISMPRMNGMEAIGEVKKQSPNTRILILTVHKTEEYVHASLKAGADGYISKDANHNELLMAIENVLCGKRYLSPEISNKVINGYLEGRKGLEQDFKWNSLTTRERAVLKLVAEGLRNKEIADLLCISLNTVEKHRDNLMKKLDLHNASSLTLYAQEKGLLSE